MTDGEPTSPAPDPAPSPERRSLVDRLGPRAERRMSPRIGVAIAGAGALIAVGGATGLGGDQLVSDDGDVQQLPGIILSLLVIIAGYVTLTRAKAGALAAAGTTAAALGVPVLLFFVTFDTDDFPPFSIDPILLVSAVAWFVAYVAGPSAGRLFFLALALLASWAFVLNLLEPVENLTPFSFVGMRSETVEAYEAPEPSFDEDGNFVFPEDGDFEAYDEDDLEAPTPQLDFGYQPPDFTDVGIVSLLIGAAYAVAGLVLTRRGLFGTGTAFAAATLPALGLGIGVLAPDLEEIGTGLLLVAVGLGLAAIGAASARRVTAWVGAGAVALGAMVLVEKGVHDASATSQSFAYLLLGVAVVMAGHLVSVGLGEPDEEDEGPSMLAWTRRGPGAGPALEDDPTV
jgi:hypothetical protein